ncbi:MAG TPA: RlmE family RNA methyltransferase [Terriglobales bacterium]|nr:RlmE family RNA methyltransferase [Terriglobales bacterium]
MYRRKDAYYHRAKESGFRSRAAFKLIELAQSERLFRPGDTVLDLGAWPGGWVQVAAKLVGPQGRVIAVDRRAIESVALPNVITITGDLFDAEIAEQVHAATGGRIALLLSDLAPSLTGVRARDEAEATRLVELVLSYADRGLLRGASLLTKLFMSGDFKQVVGQIEARFEQVRILRPDATRKGSAELYALARRFRGVPE